jgi:hypothetical protein
MADLAAMFYPLFTRRECYLNLIAKGSFAVWSGGYVSRLLQFHQDFFVVFLDIGSIHIVAFIDF